MEFRVGGGHGGLLQRVGGQLGRRLHRGDGGADGFGHCIGVEGGAGRLGLHGERVLLLVECDDRVRRRGGRGVELVDGSAHRIREAAPAGSSQAVGFVVLAGDFERPQPGVRVAQRVGDDGLPVERDARIFRGELHREALPRNRHGVIAQGVVEDGLHFGRRFQRHVVISQHGVRHEAVGEVKAAGHVGDQQQTRDATHDDADDLGRREAPSGGGFGRACGGGSLVGGCGVFHEMSWMVRRTCVVPVERSVHSKGNRLVTIG